MRAAVILSVAALTGTVACSATDDSELGTQQNPAPSSTGPYTVTSDIDVTVEVFLPQQVEAAVLTLREFSTNPARAIINYASKAGVPAVGVLYSFLPQPLKDQLEGWINAEINMVKVNGMPITAYAGQIAALAETALTQFALQSEFDLTPPTSTHRLTALDLTPSGYALTVPITGLAGDILTQTPAITVGPAGKLDVGIQHFGLNYGEYAWQGIEAISTHVFGSDVRGTLGTAVNCPLVADRVAAQCVIGVCVGHKSELQAICEGGLDEIVKLAHDKLAAMRLEALRYKTGTATLVDDDADGVADRIVDGVWDTELEGGQGLRHVPATFVGDR